MAAPVSIILMRTYSSIYFPGKMNPFMVVQEYAAQAYAVLFILLMLLMFSRMSSGLSVLFPGIAGVFLTVVLSNVTAVIRMKRKIAMAGINGEVFYLLNLYDLVFKRKALSFPVPYANMTIRGDVAQITYHDSIVQLKKEEWPDWYELVNEFRFHQGF